MAPVPTSRVRTGRSTGQGRLSLIASHYFRVMTIELQLKLGYGLDAPSREVIKSERHGACARYVR